jgi:hypothetical protein
VIAYQPVMAICAKGSSGQAFRRIHELIESIVRIFYAMATLPGDTGFWDSVHKIFAKTREFAISGSQSFLAWVYGGL